MKNRQAFFAGCILLFIASAYGLLSLQKDLRDSIPILIGVTAVCMVSLAVLMYLGESRKIDLPESAILLFALIFRLLFVFRLPQLSDDMHRYLWDGLQMLHGNNPYALAPALAESTDAAGADLLFKINHPQFVTIYPPASQLIFAVGAALTAGLFGLKTVLVILDMTLCIAILRLLRAMKLPAWRAALYAWHPLSIIEISGSGHIDGAGILLLFTAILILFSRQGKGTPAQEPSSNRCSLAAGFTFSAAVLVKLIPFIYFPMLLFATRKRVGTAFGLLAGLILISIPFMPDLTHMFFTLGTYLQHWEYSNFAFRALRTVFENGRNARMILFLFFAAWMILSCAYFYIRRKDSPAEETLPLFMNTIYGLTFGFLLLTPTLHPWYALYLAALLPFAAGPAGLALTWAVFLSYRVLIEYALLGQWIESEITAGVIWLSPVAAGLISATTKRNRTWLTSVGHFKLFHQK